MIDILMATYNGEKFINTQIDSILCQTYKEWNLIIRDDGSTDKTVEIVKEYEKKYPNKIKFICDEKTSNGAKNNFFKLMKYSTADYIMFSDQDDYWLEKKIENSVKKIKKYEKEYLDVPILVHGDLKIVDESLKVINNSMFRMQKLNGDKNKFSDYLVQNNVTGCTMIINKKLLNLCDIIPDNAIMHDWWLALIASTFGKVFFDHNPYIYYRQHANNVEGAKDITKFNYILKKILDYKSIKCSLEQTNEQAKDFKKVYYSKLKKSDQVVLNEFINLQNKSKLKKIMTIRKFKFYKSGFIRCIGYFIFV